MSLFSFLKRKKRFFPDDMKGRRKAIMQLHRSIAGDDVVRNQKIIDFVLDQLDGEDDVFLIDSYILYYFCHDDPFDKANRETAIALCDRILADGGWSIEHSDMVFRHIDSIVERKYCIEDIVAWQRAHAVHI